jgi:hypothetical protein
MPLCLSKMNKKELYEKCKLLKNMNTSLEKRIRTLTLFNNNQEDINQEQKNLLEIYEKKIAKLEKENHELKNDLSACEDTLNNHLTNIKCMLTN